MRAATLFINSTNLSGVLYRWKFAPGTKNRENGRVHDSTPTALLELTIELADERVHFGAVKSLVVRAELGEHVRRAKIDGAGKLQVFRELFGHLPVDLG